MEKVVDSNICFVGGVFDDEINEIRYSKNSIQNAANKFQWKLITGIESILQKKINVISAKFIGGYPTEYKKLIIKSHSFFTDNFSTKKQVGFVNIWGIKNIFREKIIYSELVKWYHSDNHNKLLIIYSLHLPFINAAIKLKKKYKNINIHFIIPDLPEYMRLKSNKNIVYDIFKKKDTKIIRKNIPCFDSYTILTKHMADNLNLRYDKCTVIEGISDDIDESNYSTIDKKSKTILYTGTLNYKYGIKELVDSFLKIDMDDITLEICGLGEAKEYVINQSKKNPQIKYLGWLESKQIKKLQMQASILINPRKNTGNYVKYSFPSKIIEYMSTGTPVMSYKLDGIPNDYDDYLYYIDDKDPNGLTNKMIEIFNVKQTDLDKFGQEAKRFVAHNKSKEIQAKKILDLISSTL